MDTENFDTHYTLVGVSLIIYYILLLSISEVAGFSTGYLLASLMTVGLIGLFIQISLNRKSLTVLMVASLTILYTICYIMMSLESYALLMGSLLLFAVLTTIMIVYARSVSKTV